MGSQMENHQDDAIFVLQKIYMIISHTFKELDEGQKPSEDAVFAETWYGYKSGPLMLHAIEKHSIIWKVLDRLWWGENHKDDAVSNKAYINLDITWYFMQ